MNRLALWHVIPSVAPLSFRHCCRSFPAVRCFRRVSCFQIPRPRRPAPKLLRSHVDSTHHHHHPAAKVRDEHAKDCEKVTIAGGVVNSVLLMLKVTAGYAGSSTAMIADAAHTFSDLVGDGISYLAVHKARQPANAAYPFGHGKFESVGALFTASLLMFTAYETGKASVSSLAAVSSGIVGGPTGVATAGALFSIVIKELLFRITLAVGKRASSPATIANAYHHRSDALTSVVALLGIGAAQLGWTACDPLAGIAVSLYIAHIGWQIGHSSLQDLVDNAADIEEIGLKQCLEVAAKEIPEIAELGPVRARRLGPFIAVSIHVFVDPQLTVAAAEHVHQGLRHRILNSVPVIHDVTIVIRDAEAEGRNPLRHDHTSP